MNIDVVYTVKHMKINSGCYDNTMRYLFRKTNCYIFLTTQL